MKTILFDHDGTLINSLEAIVTVTNRTLNARGFPAASPVEVLTGIPYPTEQRFSRLTGIEEPAELEGITNEFYRLYDEDVADLAFPYPGVPELLGELFENGFRMGVVSNCRGTTIRKVLIASRLALYFPVILGIEELGAHKPEPQGLLQAAAALNSSPEDCWYVGDGPPDFQAARNAGMSSAMVSWGILNKEEIRTLRPEAVFDSPGEIRDFFLGEDGINR